MARAEVVAMLKLWGAWAWVVIGLALFSLHGPGQANYSQYMLLGWVAATPLFIGLWHFGVRRLIRLLSARNGRPCSAVIVGAGELGRNLGARLLDAPSPQIELTGFFDDKLAVGSYPLPGKPVQVHGRVEDVVALARARRIEQVYITLPMRAEHRVRQLIEALADTTVSVLYVPNVQMFDLMQARWMNLGGIPVISVYETPFDAGSALLKRLQDILVAGTALLVAAVPMLAIAVGVKLSSPGPVIFRQRRYGLNGEEVEVWKFRTMSVCEDGAVIRQAQKNDARITPLGSFLRRTSLDELPQFINVLQGTMSIVGPRPHAVAHNEEYRRLVRGYMLRHKVKPGITGWAQINGWRGETDSLEKMQKRVSYDLDYINRWSLWMDLKIIARTVGVIFFDKHAY
jgi:putative colanic acid biosynthesis UDP-glucose lipid carrier transferase